MPYPNYNNREAGEIIEDEGIAYAVQDYVDGKAFKDKRLGELWDAAGAALNALEKYMRDELGVID